MCVFEVFLEAPSSHTFFLSEARITAHTTAARCEREHATKRIKQDVGKKRLGKLKPTQFRSSV